MFAAYDIHAGQYLLSFNAERPCAEYAAAMQDVDFRQLIKDAQAEGVIDYTTASSFLEEHDYAEAYRENTAEYPADERIAELAQEITEHCTNDYEKAMSIEKWFGEQEYVYDLEFIPESTDPSYFIFESKRGICSDFATAMTLLAREAGLSARYVEGFSLSPEIMDENGVYNVTAKNAHAYTQIYITGCGWVTFDATRYALVQEQDDTADRLLGAVVVVTAAAAVVFLIVLILRKPLSRLMFAVTYPMRGKRSCIKGVYLRARDIACELSGRDASCTTTGETQRVLTNVLSMPDEAQRICTAAERIMYSSEAADVDTKELYQCLKKLYRRKRGMR
ncbi:MAG: transglutaminase domain-containing protein [Ruminococcaceae bacterium]|nr:transglutaminase domain-containing protein [Oscillospiraceae bacterium]